jgi:hypothetical protein
VGKRDNKPLGAMRSGEFINQLSNYWFLIENSGADFTLNLETLHKELFGNVTDFLSFVSMK